MIHKSIKETIIEFSPISSRICTIRTTAKPLNIFIIQIYSLTSDYTDEQMENFYSQLQSTIDSMKRNICYFFSGTGTQKLGRIHSMTVVITVELLEFTSYNDLIVANTLGKHKQSRIFTWHSPNGTIHNQIEYILIKILFRSGITVAKK